MHFAYIISFNLATLEVAYYYYAHFTGENRHRESEQWSKDSNPGALRSRAHALWLEAGGGKPGLKLNPFQVIHWSFGQWRDEDL